MASLLKLRRLLDHSTDLEHLFLNNVPRHGISYRFRCPSARWRALSCVHEYMSVPPARTGDCLLTAVAMGE